MNLNYNFSIAREYGEVAFRKYVTVSKGICSNGTHLNANNWIYFCFVLLCIIRKDILTHERPGD